eukprot:gene781-972_t
MKKTFNLDPTELVLYTIKCTHKSRSGKLRITDNHLCFSASLLGSEKKKIISFEEIAEVINQDKKGVKITTKNNKNTVFHFKENESAFLLIEGQWQNSGNDMRNRLTESTSSLDSIKVAHVKHFNLPDSEKVQKSYHCTLKASPFKQYGKIYLTYNYICFYSKFISGHSKKIIKLKDVIGISITKPEKKNSRGITIDTKTETYKFSSFNDREGAFENMNQLYENCKNGLAPPVSSQPGSRSGSRSGSREQSPAGSRRGSLSISNNAVPISASPSASPSTSRRNSTSITNTTPTPTQNHPLSSQPSPSPSPSHSRKNSTSSASSHHSTTTPTFIKSHSRSNSLSTPTTTTTTTTSTTTNSQPQPQTQPPPPSPKSIASRLEKIETVSPTPSTQPIQTKIPVKKPNRTCCIGFFN